MPSNLNPKDVLQAIYDTLTASPSLINSTTLKQIALGVDVDADEGFPFVRIYLDSFQSPVHDTTSYRRSYVFAIDILQEFTQKAKADAEKDLANAVHAVLNRLQGTWQLGIGAEISDLQSSPIRTVEISGTPLRMASIRLVITSLIQSPA